MLPFKLFLVLTVFLETQNSSINRNLDFQYFFLDIQYFKRRIPCSRFTIERMFNPVLMKTKCTFNINNIKTIFGAYQRFSHGKA